MAVRLTEKAAEQLKAVCVSRRLPTDTTMLRIDGERSETEGKIKLAMELDDGTPGQDDLVETTDGAQLVINKFLGDALGEACVDFREDQGGFLLERLQ